MAVNFTPILEKLRSAGILQNKGLLIFAGIIMVLIAVMLYPDGSKKPPPGRPGASTETGVKLKNEAMVDVALQKEKVVEPPPLTVTPPPERIIVDNSNKTPRPTPQRQTSVVNVEGRKPTSLEQVRAVWDVDWTPVSSVHYTGAVVQRPDPPVVAAAEQPQVVQEPQKPKSNIVDHIMPGSEISAVLTTGMLAAESQAVPFVARVTGIKGPKGTKLNSYVGCLIYGNASLNKYTQRAEATTTYLACSDRVTSLTSVGIGDDKTYGLNGRYYERLTDRLVYQFFGRGLGEYFDARSASLELNEVYTNGDVIVKNKNIVDPHEYAIWKGLAGAADSTEAALLEIGQRQVPVLAVDPGRRVAFIVSQPTTVHAIYEVE